jgi:hypothetical protein
MSEVRYFSDTMSENSHGLSAQGSIEIVAESFQAPTSSCQHININVFPYTTTTTQPPTAAVEHPGQPRASLSMSTISCTTPPPPLCSTYVACPSNHIEDHDDKLGELKECEESVEGE